MKTVSMSGSPRASVGKKDARDQRKIGNIPCVMYGGDEQIHFSVPEKDFKPLIFTPDVHYVNLDINGKQYQAILQDIQYHPVSDKILHADFLVLHPEKSITISIPVKLEGNSVGVRKGGKLMKKYRKIKVMGLPGDIPDSINLDITKLDIGNSIIIKNLSIPNVQILESSNNMVVSVVTARTVTAEEEIEEETAEATETPAEEEKE